MFDSHDVDAVISDARRAIRRSDRINAEVGRRIERLKQIEQLFARATDGAELHWLADQVRYR